MQTLSEIQREAMKLPDGDRACLASRVLDSLPAVLSDDGEGLAEAIRRSEEMDRNPGMGMTLQQVMEAGKR